MGFSLYTQNGRLSRLEAASPAVELEESTAGKLNAQDIRKAQTIVADAQRTGRSIDPTVLHQIGLRLVSAASSENLQVSSASWDAVQEFVNYRSFLNSSLVPDTGGFTPYLSCNATTWVCHPTVKWTFELHPVVYQYLYFSMEYRAGRLVPAAKAAVLERLGEHLNSGVKVGPEYLLMNFGGTISQTLDGYRFKNVIFRDVKILYKGGPVEMENVYFVNCTFQAINKPTSRDLLRAALAAAPTTFKIS